MRRTRSERATKPSSRSEERPLRGTSGRRGTPGAQERRAALAGSVRTAERVDPGTARGGRMLAADRYVQGPLRCPGGAPHRPPCTRCGHVGGRQTSLGGAPFALQHGAPAAGTLRNSVSAADIEGGGWGPVARQNQEPYGLTRIPGMSAADIARCGRSSIADSADTGRSHRDLDPHRIWWLVDRCVGGRHSPQNLPELGGYGRENPCRRPTWAGAAVMGDGEHTTALHPGRPPSP